MREEKVNELSEWLKDRMKKYQELKNEKVKLQGFADGAARLYQIKLKDKLLKIGNELRQNTDQKSKTDLLSKQLQILGALIIVASNVGASGVISKVGLLSALITEEEIEECFRL